MANKILVVLEQRDGLIKRSGFEAASTAANLAKDINASVEAVVVGDAISNLNDIIKVRNSESLSSKKFRIS